MKTPMTSVAVVLGVPGHVVRDGRRDLVAGGDERGGREAAADRGVGDRVGERAGLQHQRDVALGQRIDDPPRVRRGARARSSGAVAVGAAGDDVVLLQQAASAAARSEPTLPLAEAAADQTTARMPRSPASLTTVSAQSAPTATTMRSTRRGGRATEGTHGTAEHRRSYFGFTTCDLRRRNRTVRRFSRTRVPRLPRGEAPTTAMARGRRSELRLRKPGSGRLVTIRSRRRSWLAGELLLDA